MGTAQLIAGEDFIDISHYESFLYGYKR